MNNNLNSRSMLIAKQLLTTKKVFSRILLTLLPNKPHRSQIFSDNQIVSKWKPLLQNSYSQSECDDFFDDLDFRKAQYVLGFQEYQLNVENAGLPSLKSRKKEMGNKNLMKILSQFKLLLSRYFWTKAFQSLTMQSFTRYLVEVCFWWTDRLKVLIHGISEIHFLGFIKGFKRCVRQSARQSRQKNLLIQNCQNSIEIAYGQYVKGNETKNLEILIKCYESALIVITKDNSPKDWASIQHDLATAYSQRVKDDEAKNLEMSIKCYKSALRIRTKDDSPEEWASTQDSLGIAYSKRIKGKKTENLEMSIKCYEFALEIRTRDKFPLQWAMTQHNLATAYSKRLEGDTTENLEMSIKCYEFALEIRTKDKLPLQWAMTQHNLATSYSKRIKGDKTENLKMSIKCYEFALEIRTRDKYPLEWATTQNNLATAYSKTNENLELAIQCYEAILKERTKKDCPKQWAMVQNNLANAYRKRIIGDINNNLKMAIDHFKAALEVFNEFDYPDECVKIQSNLAFTYSCIKDDRTKNWESSINCYQKALEICTVKSFQHECVSIHIRLAQFSILRCRNYEAATEHLEEAYKQLRSSTSNTGLLALTMFELARCLHRTGALGQAKIYFKDSIRLYQRLEQPTQVAAITSELGNLELQMGQIDDSRLHLQEALEFYKATGDIDRIQSIQELQQYLPALVES